MGLLSRLNTVFQAKASRLLDGLEDPQEILDFSYTRQLELLQKVKRSLVDVVTARKRLELQAVELKAQVARLEDQARDALRQGREDLAQAALTRREAMAQQLRDLDAQVQGLLQEQEKLQAVETRLQAKVESFRTKKEVIKAQYSAAEAQVKISEAATGLSEELADVGMALQRAQDKTERLRARAAALDEMVESGALEDALGNGDPLESELRRVTSASRVQEELERLKKEVQAS